MENEEKLRLTIDHHNNSTFRVSDSLVYDMYHWCTILGLHETIIHSYILHLLSHGATICTKDLDDIYHLTYELNNDFFYLLLHMDLRKEPENSSALSPLYFHYNITPDLSVFLNSLYESINEDWSVSKHFAPALYIRQFFCFTDKLKIMVLSHPLFLRDDAKTFRNLFLETDHFPSLTQLARDKTREVIITFFKIRNSRQLITYVKRLDIAQHVKEIILFKRTLYSYDE